MRVGCDDALVGVRVAKSSLEENLPIEVAQKAMEAAALKVERLVCESLLICGCCFVRFNSPIVS